MKRPKILIALTLTSIYGCVHSEAWIQDSQPNKGIIGYKLGKGSFGGVDPQTELDTEFSQRASEICGGRAWKVVHDGRHSKDAIATSITPYQTKTDVSYNVNTRSNTSADYYSNTGHRGHADAYGTSTSNIRGTETSTEYVPQVYSYTEYWREAEIECLFAINGHPILGVSGIPEETLKGLTIVSVVDGSPADQAKLKPGDVITELGGYGVYSMVDVTNALVAIKTPSTSATICRKKKSSNVEVSLMPSH